MTKSITISRRRVLWTTLMIPLAIPMTGIGIFLFQTESRHSAFEDVVGFALLGLIFGAIFWIPSILGALGIEMILLKPECDKKMILISLISEAALAFILINTVLDFEFTEFSLPLAFGICSAQVFRWIVIVHSNKSRVSNTSDIVDNDDI